MAWSIEAALASKMVDRVIVSTDSEDIASVAQLYGAETPFIRPAELATDDTLISPVCVHAIETLGLADDIIAISFANNPMISGDDIDGFIELLQSRPEANSVCMVADQDIRMARLFTRKPDGLLEHFTTGPHPERKQDCPDIYSRLDGLVVARAKALLADRSTFLPPPVLGYTAPEGEYCDDIHSPFDLDYTEWLLSRRTK